MNEQESWTPVPDETNPFLDDPFESDPLEALEQEFAAPFTAAEQKPPAAPVQADTAPPDAPLQQEIAAPMAANYPVGAPDSIARSAQSGPASLPSDGTPPSEKESPGEDTQTAEARKRAEHEAAEARRKAEWEAKQQERQMARQAQLDRIAAMNREELTQAAMQKASAETEKLTRRNMKECVSEYIQTLCLEDTNFARMTMQPPKTMIRCFQYINRKAWEYVQDELKAMGQRPGPGNQAYGCDIPDDLCYTWAEEYFRDPHAKEDEEEEEKFVPKPYAGSPASKSKGKAKTAAKKAPAEPCAPKPAAQTPAGQKPVDNGGQLSLLGDFAA